MKRTIRHLALAGASVLVSLTAAAAAPPGQALDAISFATAWLCLLFLAAALLIGPLHVLRTGRLVGNHLLRRDLGIWGAVTGLVHLALAFKVSMTPEYMQVYVYGAESWPAPEMRRAMYRWAVIASLVIAALFLLLLALSNNAAIRLLGHRWWKRLQRASYLAFVLTVAHSAAFQLIEARSPWLAAALALITAAVIAAQVAGWSRLRAAAAG